MGSGCLTTGAGGLRGPCAQRMSANMGWDTALCLPTQPCGCACLPTPTWVCLPLHCGQQEGKWTCPAPRSHSPPPRTSLQPLCSKWRHVTSYDKWYERSSGISLFRVKARTQEAVRLLQALSLPGHWRPLFQRLSCCQSLAGAS